MGVLQLLSAVAFAAYAHPLETVVLRAKLVPLPSPLYVVDVYMGGWNEFDLRQHQGLDLGTKIWYAPDPVRVGNYSTSTFGSLAFVRKRLQLLRQSGLTPAIHIMNRHRIVQNLSSQQYYLSEWSDEGAMVNGTMLFSTELFEKLYRPLLEELAIPYLLIYDMWGFSSWAPSGMPMSTFSALYWEEFSYLHRSMALGEQAGLDNQHIRIHEYTDSRAFNSFHFAIYLYEGSYDPSTAAGRKTRSSLAVHAPQPTKDLCDPDSLRMSLLLARGNPGGTGMNPHTGTQPGHSARHVP
jgi:hypothetical protein